MGTIAAIDLGANSIRMTVAQLINDNLKILDKFEHPLRLGKYTFIKRYIGPEALKETINILTIFKQKFEEYGIQKYRAVATSAIRSIENQDFFIEQVRLKTGINIEIIEKSEEERLVYLGLKEQMSNFKSMVKKGLIITKVGSGNVEFSIIKSNEVFFSRSIPIGGLRLRQNLSEVSEQHFLDAMEKYIHSDLKMLEQSIPKLETKYFIGAGTLLRIIHGIINPESSEINIKDLEKFYNNIKDKSFEQLSSEYNLPIEYADLILPSTYIYLSFLKLSNAKEIRFINLSFTACILKNMAGLFKNKFITKQMWKSAINIGEKYHFDRKHAIQVSKLAVKIFDALKPLHNLSIKHRFILKLAGLWHDIGIFIKNSEHHKHSHYLISNIEMPGLSKNDTNLIATIARYHRRSMPKKYHEEYISLRDRDRVVVSKLAAILRVADSLDRSHSQTVENLKIEIKDNEIIFYTNFKEGGWLEKIHFNNKKNLFLKVFGINIELIESFK